MYDPSKVGWNFPLVGLAVFSKTLLKTNSSGTNVRGFTHQLCKFSSLYCYDAISTIAASRSSSIVSRSLAMASKFSFLGISFPMVDSPIFVGMMASIPYMRGNDDMPVGF